MVVVNESTAVPSEFRLDPLSKVIASFVIASRFLRRNNTLHQTLETLALNRHASAHASHDSLASIPVRAVYPTSETMANVARMVRARSEPLVFPGFARNCYAVDNWSSAFFKERYGSTMLRVTGDEFDFSEMRLSEIVDIIQSGAPQGQKYVQAAADMFVLHPELFNELPMEKIFAIQKAGFHGAEFFLGGSGTGSTWHAANEWNFFLMIAGKKHWKLLRPEFTLQMQPAYQRDLIFVTSKKYKYEAPPDITTYSVDLQAGDMLVVPPWWWHCVRNLTPETVAVSIRIRTLLQQIRSPNMTLSLLQMTAPLQWKNMWIERIRGKLKDDQRYHTRAGNLIY